jgi:hypothetical protein
MVPRRDLRNDPAVGCVEGNLGLNDVGEHSSALVDHGRAALVAGRLDA